MYIFSIFLTKTIFIISQSLLYRNSLYRFCNRNCFAILVGIHTILRVFSYASKKVPRYNSMDLIYLNSSYCSISRLDWHLPVWGCRGFTEPSLSATRNKSIYYFIQTWLSYIIYQIKSSNKIVHK